ncbi:hypothetical protein CL616_03055 [archaeon]|nr:hypothetical protein [archaeon]|tara:strand:- start:1143 stop:2282 length:1140 start_codon:yes stop_codon:yes gene_type:complete
MKKLTLALVIFLVAFTAFVSASDNYEIEEVYVNDILATNTVQVELDTELTIDVYLEGTGLTKDVKVKAWFGGYEYDLIEDYTDMFDIEQGVSYKKTLTLEIPEDLNLDDNYYTLYVQIYDSQEYEQFSSTIYFEEPRHKVAVKDIIFSNTAPDEYLGVKVRLTNLGENKEEDIRVTLSIPDLGLSTRTYVDELAARNQDTENTNDEVTIETLYLKLPSNAYGDYEVQVQVDYNNDYSTTIKSEYVRVAGYESYDDSAIVSISPLSDLKVGKETQFKVQITNLEENPQTFYIEVDGNFEANFTEEITLSQTQEMFISITPLESGVQSLDVKVSTDKGIVTQNTYSHNVKEQTKLFPILFGVVLAVIVIIVVLFILSRLRE